MFITKIKLINFCQHTFIEQELDGHLIGVIGNNGTGKSNLLNSLMFAFIGEVPGREKASLLTDGEIEGSVYVEFRSGDMKCSIYRALHNSDAKLTLGDEEFEGITNVNTKLAERMMIDKDISKQAVFVRQEELNSILFTQPAVRERSWHSMIGLGDATKIYSKLGPCLSIIPEPMDYAETMEQLSLRIQEELELYRGAQASLRAAQTTLLGLKGSVSPEGLKALTELKSAVDNAAAAAQTEAELNASLRSNQADLETVLQRITEIQPDPSADMSVVVADATTLANELERQYESITTLTQLKEQLTKAETGLACMADEKLPDTPGILKKLTEMKQSLDEASGMAKAYDALLKAFSENREKFGDKCPLCKSEVSDPAKLLNDLTQTVDRLRKDTVTINSEHEKLSAEYTAAENTVKNHEAELASVKSGIDTLKGRVESLESSVTKMNITQEEVEDAKLQVTTLNQQLTELNGLKGRQATLQGTVAQIQTQLIEVGGQVHKYSDDVKTLAKKTGADITALETALSNAMEKQNAYTTAAEDVSSAKTLITELRRGIRKLISDYREIRNKDAAGDDFRALRKTAENIRNWFHYSQGPHRVVTEILCRLTPDVNNFLGKFGSPFTVYPDPDNVLFRYIKGEASGTGDELPSVERLSGGERVMLAVSFRTACYCMFASKLGLMTLDEPTVYLDQNNVQMFGHLLEKLKEITSILDLQILMSTHETSVIPLLDTVINLNNETQESNND